MPIAVDAVYENGVLKPKQPLDLPEHAEVQVTVTAGGQAPRTALGARLLELRAKILESGEPLLDREEILAEVAARRGGWQEPR